MKKRIMRTIIFHVLLVLFLLPPVHGQVTNTKKFSAVPKQLRERLVERFNAYIEYDRTQQNDKLYDLYSESYIKGQKLTKASFLEVEESIPKSSRSVLIEYRPTSVSRPYYTKESGVYEIVGRAKVQRGAKVIEEERILVASLQNGDWYFTGWLERT